LDGSLSSRLCLDSTLCPFRDRRFAITFLSFGAGYRLPLLFGLAQSDLGDPQLRDVDEQAIRVVTS